VRSVLSVNKSVSGAKNCSSSTHDLDAQDLALVTTLLLRNNACFPCSIEIRGAKDFVIGQPWLINLRIPAPGRRLPVDDEPAKYRMWLRRFKLLHHASGNRWRLPNKVCSQPSRARHSSCTIALDLVPRERTLV
jgi:hypothetical protein